MRRLSGRLAKAGVIDVVATAAPGPRRHPRARQGQAARARPATHDLILLDAPAAGHAVTFLRSAKGLLDAVTVGPIATQAQDVLELLGDADRCQVVLVTLPEETPVNEMVETAFALEDEVGVQLGPDRRQRPLPGPTRAGGRAGRRRPATTSDAEPGRGRPASAWPARPQQDEQLARLADRLPLPQVHLPFLLHGRPHRRRPRAAGRPPARPAGGARGMTAVRGAGPPARPWRRLVAERTIVVCCGAGRRRARPRPRPCWRAEAAAAGAGRRRHDRPGQAAGRRARPGRADQRPEPVD